MSCRAFDAAVSHRTRQHHPLRLDPTALLWHSPARPLAAGLRLASSRNNGAALGLGLGPVPSGSRLVCRRRNLKGWLCFDEACWCVPLWLLQLLHRRCCRYRAIVWARLGSFDSVCHRTHILVASTAFVWPQLQRCWQPSIGVCCRVRVFWGLLRKLGMFWGSTSRRIPVVVRSASLCGLLRRLCGCGARMGAVSVRRHCCCRLAAPVLGELFQGELFLWFWLALGIGRHGSVRELVSRSWRC